MTTGTYRYQDRWKWFLPASWSSLNPSGPQGKTKNLFYRTRNCIEKILKISLLSLLIPFLGPIRGGIFFTTYRIIQVQPVLTSSSSQLHPQSASALLSISGPGIFFVLLFSFVCLFSLLFYIMFVLLFGYCYCFCLCFSLCFICMFLCCCWCVLLFFVFFVCFVVCCCFFVFCLSLGQASLMRCAVLSVIWQITHKPKADNKTNKKQKHKTKKTNQCFLFCFWWFVCYACFLCLLCFLFVCDCFLFLFFVFVFLMCFCLVLFFCFCCLSLGQASLMRCAVLSVIWHITHIQKNNKRKQHIKKTKTTNETMFVFLIVCCFCASFVFLCFLWLFFDFLFVLLCVLLFSFFPNRGRRTKRVLISQSKRGLHRNTHKAWSNILAAQRNSGIWLFLSTQFNRSAQMEHWQ